MSSLNTHTAAELAKKKEIIAVIANFLRDSSISNNNKNNFGKGG
jgi:hypothetical protein